MRERKECHCMLFLTPENPFVGKEQKLPDDILQDGAVMGVL
jgi:ferredoxin-thioredoxin reductase catalytic chain